LFLVDLHYQQLFSLVTGDIVRNMPLLLFSGKVL
jgi:hypothetical protein